MMKKALQLLMICMFSVTFSQSYETQIPKPDKVVSKDSVYTNVDVAAEYPGGIYKFRQQLADNLDLSVLKGGNFKSELTFVVLEDGEIQNLQTTGNNSSLNFEVRKAFGLLKKKIWIPAKINGIPVKFKFKIPINMNIQE